MDHFGSPCIVRTQTFVSLILICLQVTSQRSASGSPSQSEELVLDGQPRLQNPQAIVSGFNQRWIWLKAVAQLPFSPQRVLFGSSHNPWVPSDWVDVSDTVRGGSSVAHLDLLESGFPAAGIRFYGTLNTTTLGGAGFASQSYRRHLLCFPSERFSGLVLELGPLSSASKPLVSAFTLVLKNEVATIGSDGRQQSTTSYEFDFSVPFASPETNQTSALDQRLFILIPFVELRPTYRGRPKPDAKKFDSSHITELSFMCRSFFNQQSGPFDLNIFRIGVVQTAHDSCLEKV